MKKNKEEIVHIDEAKVIKRLLRYVLRYWPVMALGCLALMISGGTNTALLAAFKEITDKGFVGRDSEVIAWLPWILGILGFLRAGGGFGGNYAMSWLSRKVVADLRVECFSNLLLKPIAFFDHNSTGVLTSKITYDCEQVASLSSRALISIIQNSMMIIGGLGYMLWMDWKLTLGIIALSPLVMRYIRSLSPKQRQMSQKAQAAMGKITQVAEEAASGQRVVKIFSGQEYETNRMKAAVHEERKMKVRAARLSSLSSSSVEFLATLLVTGLIAYAARSFTAGEFTTFIGAMFMIMGPAKALSGMNELIQRALVAAKSVFDIMDVPDERFLGIKKIDQVKGTLELVNVSFRYPESTTNAIDNVSLVIPAGKQVALVGRSGSGKSTIVSLLAAFYEPTAGTIRLDGIDYAAINPQALREHIALVSQEIVLFNDTVANNIAYGRLRGASKEAIIHAAKAAYAWEFIENLPQGLDSMIGDRGVRLSGGQRQRLAIARAILKNAPILLLDEATSALDTESEIEVQKALEALMRNRTSVVIAHRLSTVRNADFIVVMDNGHILEVGTNEALLAKNGYYRRLYEKQFAIKAHALVASGKD